MAIWSRNKKAPSTLNNGNEYQEGDWGTIELFNDANNNAYFAVDSIEALGEAPDVSEAGVVGTPNVTLIPYDKAIDGITKTFKKFKFSNLRGEKGDAGTGALVKQELGTSTDDVVSQNGLKGLFDGLNEIATTTTKGLMSSADKVRLDGIADNATANLVKQEFGTSTEDAISQKVITDKFDDLETAVTELHADVNTLELTPNEIFGLHWDKASNTFTRTNSARDVIVNLGVDNEVKFNEMDYSSLFSDWEEVTDSYGNVFIRAPRKYFKKANNADWELSVASAKPIKGGYLPWCYWDFVKNRELPYVDIGKHIGSLSDDTTRLESKPDKYPLINKNIVQMRTLAQANGAGYQQLDIHTVDFLQTLFTIEQATLDSQSKLFGYTNGRHTATDLAVITESDTNRVVLSNATAALYEVGQSISIGTTQGGNQIFYGRTITEITVYDASNKALVFDGDPVTITAGNMVYNTGYKTGFSANIASSVGSVKSNSSGKHPFVWHGIESLYGDVWQFVDGLNINDNQSWVCRDADDYASNLFASPYEKLSYINATNNNYVLTRGFDRVHPYAQLPTTVGAVGDSQYKDYHYQATGQGIASVGGHWYNGSNAGLFAWLLSDSSAAAFVGVGGRLLKKAL